MQRIAVTTQGADLRTMIGKHLLKGRERAAIVKHRQLTVRITRIIPRAKLDRIDAQRSELLENVRQRKLRQQGCEDSDTHGDCCLLTTPSALHFSTVGRTHWIARAF